MKTTRFVVGRYYRWVGPKDKNKVEGSGNWSHRGYMDSVLDGKPRKCTQVDDCIPNAAQFENMTPNTRINGEGFPEVWYWGTPCLKYFKDCTNEVNQ